MTDNLKELQNRGKVDFRDNAFDLLRMIGAFIVLFSHSFRHFGINKPIYSLFFTDGSVGVIIFFAITGFVMMPAWEKMEGKKNSYLSFLFNRFLRIYPALWVSFIVITIVNIIFSDISVFSLGYLLYTIKYCVFAIGEGYGPLGISNGVLWTILPDIIFYLITPLIYKIMKNQKTWVWLLVIFGFWQFNVWDSAVIGFLQTIPFIGRFINETFFLCFLYEFLIGCFLYFKRDIILEFFKKHKIYAYLWLLIFTVFFVIYANFDFIPKTGLMHTPWIGIMVAPLSIILAFVIGKVRINWEISYGIFLFHMVVISVLKILGVVGVAGIILTLLITPIFAIASRKFVEMPMLKLKARQKKTKC